MLSSLENLIIYIGGGSFMESEKCDWFLVFLIVTVVCLSATFIYSLIKIIFEYLI